MGYIYKITNTINDKIYVGKTCTTLENRWSHHKNDYMKYDWHLYRAMRKYGIDKFNISIIEQCSDNLLNEREIYWIKTLNSFNNGYNMTEGGEGRIQVDRQIVLSQWEEGKSTKDIADLLGCWPSTIINILKENNLYNKSEIQKRKIKNIASAQSVNRIIKYDESGNVLQYYNSIYEAAQDMNTTNDNIHNAIAVGGSRMGYFWGRENGEIPNFHKITRPQIRRIAQYDLNDNLLNIYNNAMEAARATKCDHSAILKVCKKQRKTTGGYKWRYIDEEYDK